MDPPAGVGCGSAKVVSGLGVGDSPELPNGGVALPSVDVRPKRDVFVGSGVAPVGSAPRENGCIFDKLGLLFCDSDVFHWPKATFGDAGRGLGRSGTEVGDDCFVTSWFRMGSPERGELRVGLAEGLPSPMP